MKTSWRVAAAVACAAGVAVVSPTGAAAGTFPGTNGRIAFVRAVGEGGGRIVTMTADGQDITPLTNQATNGTCTGPSYSGDGERIAFSCVTGTSTASSEVFVMDANGKNQVPVTANAVGDFDPSFSPNGERIAFSRAQAGNSDIFAIDVNGQNELQLTNTPEIDAGAAFSPNGQRIVFTRFDGGDTEIWIMDANGQNQVQLTNNAVSDGAPDFSPDGQRIVFSRSSGGGGDLFVMDADGQNQTPLTSTTGLSEITPAYSPDGNRIAFAVFDGTNTNLFVADATAQDPLQVTSPSSPEADLLPDWQPLNSPACDISGEQKQKSAKQVRVTISCTEDASVTASGELKAPKAPKLGAAGSKSKKVALQPVTQEVPANTPTPVTLSPSKKGKKLLKKALKAGKKPKGSVEVNAVDDLGQSAQDSFAVKLKPKHQ
jgi:WD40 repeat protein